ncbi:MAG: sulfotransferase, partial [Pseudomonadales bacterium]|nr:sulfotransferase [Pseudomonadales bacterium]
MSIIKLLDNAEAATGLSDWGDIQFVEGLTVLRDSVAKESQTGKAGLEIFEDMATGILVKRLKVIDDRTRYPEISRQEIHSPLIVVGLPRTG